MVNISVPDRSRRSILPANMLCMSAMVLALSGYASAQSLERDLTEVEVLPVQIATVMTGGEWENGDAHGFYRIVITGSGIEHITNRIYIQWLALDFAQNGYRLVRTRSIDEINRLTVEASVETDFYGSDLPRITINTTDREMKNRSYRLTPMSDGSYQLE